MKILVMENGNTKEVISLSEKAGWLTITTRIFERENKKDDWWESCASSTSLRIKDLQDFLVNQVKE